ncbi:hypothetical protein ACFYXD_33700 [Streptomyces platensis]|uniref:hypothetical protein n=1 Tax=Streptomyces platensis TaxID=58346 RepID=UPI0036B26C50
MQRRLNRLLGNRDLLLRCDVARPLAGWPTGALLWLNVPDERLEEAGRTLGACPETRSCAAVSGANNLLVTVTLHSVDALHGWAVQLRQALRRGRQGLRGRPVLRTGIRRVVLRVPGRQPGFEDPADEFRSSAFIAACLSSRSVSAVCVRATIEGVSQNSGEVQGSVYS